MNPREPLELSRDDAERFLNALDPGNSGFTFQAFDDNQERKAKSLARVLHGSLSQHWEELAKLNREGAGIFVTVNETDGTGRKTENIKRVRAVFTDLDGAPRPAQPHLAPHIVTETSPGRWHEYWLIKDLPLAQFTSVQQRLIALYNADPAVKDLPRVMRVPGFYHRKKEPFLSRLIDASDAEPYTAAEFVDTLPKDFDETRRNADMGGQQETDTDFCRELNSYALGNLGAWVPRLFPKAWQTSQGWRVSSQDLGRDKEEDLSFTLKGIKDWGVHDEGDPNAGGRTPIDIVIEWHRCDFKSAIIWLSQALGRQPPAWARTGYRPGTTEDGGHHARQAMPEEWPVMGQEAFHGLAGDIVRTIEPHSEADPVALLLQTLVVAGSMVSRHAYYQVESDRHYANLFAVMAGNTAKGRKGTAHRRVVAIARAAEEQWVTRIKGGLSSGEGFINEVRDPIQKYDPKNEAMVTTDPGVKDKRLMIVEEEFASTLSVAERSGSTLSALIRKAWDGGVLETLTRTAPLRATNAHVSIIGHITVDELRARLTKTEAANGFANRFLFALVRRSKELPFGGELTDSEILYLGERLQQKLWPEGPIGPRAYEGQVTMTDAARAEWTRIYSNLSSAKGGLLGAVTARGEAQVVRLALVYCLLDGATQIDVSHLRAGLAVWRYCEESAAHVFGDTLGDPLADEIIAALRQAGGQGMTKTEIYHLFSGNKTSGLIGAALQLLFTKGKARHSTRPPEGRGRPAEVWHAQGCS